MSRSRPEARGAEQLLVIVAMALVAFGVVMVYSASASFTLLEHHAVYAGIGLAAAVAARAQGLPAHRRPGAEHARGRGPAARARARDRRRAQRRAALAEPARRLHAAALGAGQGGALRVRRSRALGPPAGAARLARGHAARRRRRGAALRPGRDQRPRLGHRRRPGRRSRSDRERSGSRRARPARARRRRARGRHDRGRSRTARSA